MFFSNQSHENRVSKAIIPPKIAPGPKFEKLANHQGKLATPSLLLSNHPLHCRTCQRTPSSHHGSLKNGISPIVPFKYVSPVSTSMSMAERVSLCINYPMFQQPLHDGILESQGQDVIPWTESIPEYFLMAPAVQGQLFFAWDFLTMPKIPKKKKKTEGV